MTYTVKSGDSLSAIAKDELGNIDLWPSIAKLNGINPPYVIQPGQILELPPPAPKGSVNVIPLPEGSAPKSYTTVITVSLFGLGILAFILLKKKKKKS